MLTSGAKDRGGVGVRGVFFCSVKVIEADVDDFDTLDWRGIETSEWFEEAITGECSEDSKVGGALSLV